MTAGSVGASAAPTIQAAVQPKSKNVYAARAITAAVPNVPSTPRSEIGTIAPRKRRQPTCIPPSNRITISATTPIRSTSRIESACSSRGKKSDPIVEASRNSAGAGTGNHSVSLLRPIAARKAAETTRTIRPKLVISDTAVFSRGRVRAFLAAEGGTTYRWAVSLVRSRPDRFQRAVPRAPQASTAPAPNSARGRACHRAGSDRGHCPRGDDHLEGEQHHADRP